MRRKYSFSVSDINLLRVNLIKWAKQHEYFLLLDSNADRLSSIGKMGFSSFDLLAGVGAISLTTINLEPFSELKSFIDLKEDWCFGHLCYDLKSTTHGCPSKNIDYIGFDNCHFFQPKWVITYKDNIVTIHYIKGTDKNELKNIKNILLGSHITDVFQTAVNEDFTFIDNATYIRNVQQLQKHIKRGDIYEVNYCINFLLQNVKIDPYHTFLVQNENSPAPFAAFYKHKDKFLLSSSPERFIKKTGNTIISQPIKGTIRRGDSNEEDNILKLNLLGNEKERSENIMITDLVRNDLSVTAKYESVKVEELCGLYSFKHVHQLISTISSHLDKRYHEIDAIKYAFPMGSMTGAPKHNAIKLAERYEDFKRGLYSGTVGYLTPNKDFDFNVVIRSILYNDSNSNLCIPAGSAITAQSVPENEYAECLLKTKALMEIIQKNKSFQMD
jgi:para-aminobenzoate synthetase component I